MFKIFKLRSGRLTWMLSLCFFCNSVFGQAGAPRESAPIPTIAAKITGLTKYPGFFNFYYEEKTGKVYLEIDKFDTDFLYFTSLTDGVGNGGPERGQANSALARFIKAGNKILLIEPSTNYRAITSNPDEIKAVENAFAMSAIFGFAPVAVEGDRVLVDLTSFIIRDSQNISTRLGVRLVSGPVTGRASSPSAGGAAYRLDESRSVVYMPYTKNFPLNSEFDAMLTFAGGSGGGGGRGGGIAPDPGSVTIKMHQSFAALPDHHYVPRKFDPRSAFQQFSYMDFSAPMTEPLVKRFIRRHYLEKKDPSAASSEPVKPIIYYVDRGVPAPIRKALIEGGSWWNEAFEGAGFKNAFQVKVLPEGADPMDIRYNMVNWINRSGSPARAFSSGASFVDPRTGEIMKGVVTLGSDRHRQDYLIAEGLLQPYEDGKPVPAAMEEFALARIRQLSAHEIGHTLGFNHNFAASPKDRASVMDYPFPRLTMKKDGSIDISDAYAKGIGSWDKRAVLWGYTEFPKGTNEDEALEKIMQETLKRGFQYIPDIGGYVHPSSHQWDDGEDPVAELDKLMAIRRRVLDNFSEKAIRKGEPMSVLEEVLVPMYLLHRYQIEAVAKSIGGLYFTHAVKNDGQLITKMVEPARQWKAFDALMNTISPEALALPETLIGKIPPRPSGYPSSVETFTGRTGPTFDPLAAAESAAAETISSLLNPERAARLIEYNSRDASQPDFFGVTNKLIERTWKAPLSKGYPGSLQIMVNNQVLKYLLQLSADVNASEEVRGQGMLQIKDLKEWMDSRLNGADKRQQANILFGLSQIKSFYENPDKFQPVPSLEMPPGAPIGMPGMSFLENTGW